MAMARSCWPSPRGCSPARRAPRSRAAPDPGAALAPDEQLVGGDAAAATARTLLAVVGGDDPATLVAPTTADGVGRAVLRLDADGWHREPVDAPEPVRPVALAAAGPARAWMLATAGDRVVLLRRDPSARPRWVLTELRRRSAQRGREGRGRRAPGRPAHGHVRRGLDRSSRHAARGDGARRPHGAPEGHRGARRRGADGHATPPPLPLPRRARPRRPPRHSLSSMAAGATWSRCAITRWASRSPAATAGTARWPRRRRRTRSSARARSARPSIAASPRARAPATPSAKAAMPRWRVRRSRCATASARTAARPRRPSPSPPTARASRAGRSRSAR